MRQPCCDPIYIGIWYYYFTSEIANETKVHLAPALIIVRLKLELMQKISRFAHAICGLKRKIYKGTMEPGKHLEIEFSTLKNKQSNVTLYKSYTKNNCEIKMLSIKEIYKIGYGPSSSHTIGPVKASVLFKERNPEAKSFKVYLYGSLALTGVGHHTDVAIQKTLMPNDSEIIWKNKETLPLHPNGMIFEAFNSEKKSMDRWTVYSIGGGDLQDDHGKINNKQVYDLESLTDILKYCSDEGKTFWEYVEDNEDDDIWDYLKIVWDVMKESINRGLEKEGVLPGTIKLPRKAHSYFRKALNSRKSIQNMGLLYSFALAVSEENADYGKIVTAPTCGSAGVLPAALFYLLRDEYINEPQILKAMATAGIIGNIVKTCASISGAEVGCQGEIGTACAMTAGAASQLLGGSLHQIEYAAEMGLEHYLGLTCDPIAGYVQIPCIERNAIAAAHAIECAVYTSLSDGAHKVSFDTSVVTMAETGHDLQSGYRETSTGGLAKKWVNFK